MWGPLVAALLTRFRAAARPLSVRWLLRAAACGVAFVGFVYLSLAAYLGLGTIVHPAWAAVITAGLLVLVALALLGIASLLPKHPWGQSGRDLEPANDAIDDLAEMAGFAATVGEKLKGELKGAATPLIVAAALGGVIIGFSPGLQKLLRSLLKSVK